MKKALLLLFFMSLFACNTEKNEPKSELESALDLTKKLLDSHEKLDELENDLLEWESDFVKDTTLDESTDMKAFTDSLIQQMADSLNLPINQE